jgi:hypothetical protein
MTNSRGWVCLLGAILLLCAVSTDGQEVRATIGGRVTDTQGAVVPDAAVAVTSVETGVTEETSTDAAGAWIVQFLLPGHYGFTVTKQGFKTEARQGIELQTADNKNFDVQLSVGAVSQTVTVTSEAPLIDTSTASSGTVITEAEIQELPTSSHVVTLFATLSPGVVAQYQNNNVAYLWSYNAASQFEANGGRNNIYSNNFQLDGMADTKSGGDVASIPPQDSVQEFRVQTNAYDASIGRQAGSTVNMQTKAGTSAYHGDLYEYNQNNLLNANYYQNNLDGAPKPAIHFNEFGGTFGGPVWIPKIYNGKRRTFFFVSYDDSHNINPVSDIRSVPTALERSGDFSQSFSVISGQTFNTTPYNPYSVDSKGNRQPFMCDATGNPITPVGNIQTGGTACAKIPAQMMSTIAENILKYVPLPNTPSLASGNAVNNFVSPATRTDKFPVVSARIDEAWSNSQHSFFTGRWAHLNENAYSDFNDVATGNLMERIIWQLGVDHVSILSNTKSLDMRFIVNRYANPNHDTGAGFDPTQLGFPASYVKQLVKPSFPYISGFAGNFGTNQADGYTDNTYYTWAATLTQLHGNHTFHYGGEYWILQEADGGVGKQSEFDFSNVWTRNSAVSSGGNGVGSTFASFLLGLPSGGNVPVNATGLYSQRYAGLFVQDDWRVTQNLTLNFGLRWDVERPITERDNRMTAHFDLSQINPISPAAQSSYATILAATPKCSGVPAAECSMAYSDLSSLAPASSFKIPGAQLFAGVGGQPRTFSNTDWIEFQPRAGFAYRIGQNTVVRGGFGRFVQASFEKGGQNGFSRTTTLISSADNNFDPCDTVANPFNPNCVGGSGPAGVLAPTGSSAGALTNLGQGVDFNNVNPNRAYSLEYSLHVQHQWKTWLFEAGYSHNKTYGIYEGRIQDYFPFAEWQSIRAATFDSTGRPYDVQPYNVQVPNPFNQLVCPDGTKCITGSIGGTSTTNVERFLFSDPLLGSLTRNDNPLGKNQYDALLTKIEHRFTRNFSVISSFTWSKLFEDTSYYPDPSGDNPAIRVEHKLGGEDRPYVYSLAPIWQIPVGRGERFGRSMPRFLDAFIGGWEADGQYQIQSGVPVVWGGSGNNVSEFFSGKNPALPGGGTLAKWFDTSQFFPFPSKTTNISNYPAWTGIQNLPGFSYQPASTDTIKNGVYQDFNNWVQTFPSRWGSVRTSRVNDVDIGIYKSFKFNERSSLQLRFDAFNAFNHPRFGSPDTNPNDSTFGVVTASQVNQPRAVELAGKLLF